MPTSLLGTEATGAVGDIQACPDIHPCRKVVPRDTEVSHPRTPPGLSLRRGLQEMKSRADW